MCHATSQKFESPLIRCAFATTGRGRMDAGRLLGIGRNTITRKIHAFGLDDVNAQSGQMLKSQPRSQPKNNKPHRGESDGEITKHHFTL